MTPVNPDSDSDDSQRPEVPITFLEASLETLQQQHASRLTQDVERLETERSHLESEIESLQSQISVLREDYAQLLALTADLQSVNIEEIPTERISPRGFGPLLPGESGPAHEIAPTSRDRTLELPTPFYLRTAPTKDRTAAGGQASDPAGKAKSRVSFERDRHCSSRDPLLPIRYVSSRWQLVKPDRNWTAWHWLCVFYRAPLAQNAGDGTWPSSAGPTAIQKYLERPARLALCS